MERKGGEERTASGRGEKRGERGSEGARSEGDRDDRHTVTGRQLRNTEIDRQVDTHACFHTELPSIHLTEQNQPIEECTNTHGCWSRKKPNTIATNNIGTNNNNNNNNNNEKTKRETRKEKRKRLSQQSPALPPKRKRKKKKKKAEGWGGDDGAYARVSLDDLDMKEFHVRVKQERRLEVLEENHRPHVRRKPNGRAPASLVPARDDWVWNRQQPNKRAVLQKLNHLNLMRHAPAGGRRRKTEGQGQRQRQRDRDRDRDRETGTETETERQGQRQRQGKVTTKQTQFQ